jgi:heme/copper-type cytochrome/quinol oxidase subunit 3
MTHITTTLVALKTITLGLGSLITYFAYRAYRRTDAKALGALALGFAFVTLGSLLAGAAHQAFNMDSDVVLIIESALTAAGFGIIVYSLYAE